jgi:ATP-dependent Lon protease
MITINASGYNKKDKLIIAKDYLLPTIYKTFERKKEDIVFTDDIIENIIDMVPTEEGVRNLKRGLECIISWINYYLYTDDVHVKFPFTITEPFLEKHIVKNNTRNESIYKMYM